MVKSLRLDATDRRGSLTNRAIKSLADEIVTSARNSIKIG